MEGFKSPIGNSVRRFVCILDFDAPVSKVKKKFFLCMCGMLVVRSAIL